MNNKKYNFDYINFSFSFDEMPHIQALIIDTKSLVAQGKIFKAFLDCWAVLIF